jgi:hypothetical protein
MATKVTKKSRVLARVALALALTGLVGVFSGGWLVATASAAPTGDECVPSGAWTEETDWLTESPGDGWYVIDERTVEDQQATRQETDWVTESPGEAWVQFDERTVDGALIEEAHWQHYSWNGPWGSDSEPPPWPHENWQPNTQSDPHGVGVEGPYYRSHGGSGNGDWFYLERVDAVYQQVTEYRFYLETPAVTHVECRFAFDHPAVECPDDPDNPTDPEEPPGTGPNETTDQGESPNTLGEQPTGSEVTVPHAVDSGLSGTTGGEQGPGPELLGGGLVLLLTAGGALAGARQLEAP